MNTQSSDEKVALGQTSDELFANWRVKFLLFIGSLIIAMFLSLLVYASYNHVTHNDFGDVAFLLILALFFPSGLPLSSEIGAGIYWLMYIGIMAVGIWMKNSIGSRILFWIFLLLLILNIAGYAAPHLEITIF